MLPVDEPMPQSRQAHISEQYNAPRALRCSLELQVIHGVTELPPPLHSRIPTAIRHSDNLLHISETMPLVNRPCWVCGKIWTEYVDQVCYICELSRRVRTNSRSPRNALQGRRAPAKSAASLHPSAIRFHL